MQRKIKEMKYLLISILFLITGSKGVAQIDTTHFTIKKSSTISKADSRMILYWQTGSDTIEIIEPLQIHYIKIGKDVYQLVEHNTTIEKASPSSLIIGGTFSDPNIFRLPTYYNGK
jgi:hypothetical protein